MSVYILPFFLCIFVWVPFSEITVASLESCWETENCFLLYIVVFMLKRNRRQSYTLAHDSGLPIQFSPSFLEIKNLCEVPAHRVSTLCRDLFLCLPSRQRWLTAQMKHLKLGLFNGNRHFPFQIESRCLSHNWNSISFSLFFFPPNFQRDCKIECVSWRNCPGAFCRG